MDMDVEGVRNLMIEGFRHIFEYWGVQDASGDNISPSEHWNDVTSSNSDLEIGVVDMEQTGVITSHLAKEYEAPRSFVDTCLGVVCAYLPKILTSLHYHQEY